MGSLLPVEDMGFIRRIGKRIARDLMATIRIAG